MLLRPSGPLAQSVERGADNAKVESSSLSWTNFFFLFPSFFLLSFFFLTPHCFVCVSAIFTLHVSTFPPSMEQIQMLQQI